MGREGQEENGVGDCPGRGPRHEQQPFVKCHVRHCLKDSYED